MKTEFLTQYAKTPNDQELITKYESDLKEIIDQGQKHEELAALQINSTKYTLDPKTLYFFGNVYAFGLFGYTKDANKAMEYLLSSADNADSESQYVLGTNYYFGIIMPKDYAQAAKYLRLANQYGKNDTGIFSILSTMYENGGFGIQKDKKEAKFWKNEMMKTYGLK
jgi:TPR repeat protein